ncbi:hypothetical protein DL93DRAFT_1505335 [Clavulina sp. PMI_390]|nr:hypothetical protein DL93DRAFT_1505335 [Clavulina sp. PMI_390]
MGDWDVPDQPVHFETASHHASIRSRSPAPSTSMFPSNGGMPMPAPSFQFGAPPPAGSTSPRVASLSGRGQPGSPIPPSMAMHLNSSPTAFGAGNPLPTTWGARYNSPSVRSARQFTSPRGKPASISSSSRANIATMLGETANGKLRPGGSRGSGPGLSMQEQLELNRTSPYAEPRSFIDGPPMSMPTAVPFGGVDPERASVLSNTRAPGGGPPLTGFGGMDGIPPHLAAAFQGGQPGSEGFHPEEQPPQAVPLDEAPPRAPSRSSSIFKKVLGSRSNSPTQDRKKPKAGRKPSQSSIPVHSPIPEQSVEDLPDAPPHTATSWGAWPSAPPETEDHEDVGGKREYEEHGDDGHWGAGGHATANENPNHREWGQADGPPGSSLAWGNRTSYTHSQLGHNPGPGRSVKFDDGSHSHHPHEGMSVSEHGEVRPPSIAPDVSSSWDQHAQGPLSDRGGALDDEDDDAPPPVQPLSGDWGEGGSLPGVSVAAGSHFTGGPPPPSLFSASAGLPIPKGSTVQIDSSNGRAMEPAELALFGKHRVAEERIIWTLPFAHDPRVHWMHDFIERFHYAIATFGVSFPHLT